MADVETLAWGFSLIEGPSVDSEDNPYFSDVHRGGVYRRSPDGEIWRSRSSAAKPPAAIRRACAPNHHHGLCHETAHHATCVGPEEASATAPPSPTFRTGQTV